MGLTEESIKEHIAKKETLKSGRGNFDSHWQDIGDLVYPEHANFTYTPSPGTNKMTKIFDSVQIHSNQLLASGLFSLLTSSASPWFHLMPVDAEMNKIREVNIYLEDVSNVMYHEINKPSAGFSSSIHEGYLEYGAFGNITLFVEEILNKSSLRFMALPLSECYFIENAEGINDTMYRTYDRTVDFLMRKFGVDALSEKVQKLIAENKLDTVIKGLHVVLPRVLADRYSIKSTDLPFASLYIDCESNHVMQEGGFHELPFMAARFYKSSHETYGRGPGSTALSDIKMLMRVAQVTIRAAQKTVDPPIILPDRGFLRPFRTIPGGLNYYERGRINSKRDIDILPTGNPGFGIEYMQQLHEKIREVFFVNQLQLNTGPQMTATEVMQRTEEKLRLLGPLLGRLQTELLGPLIVRVYGLLQRANKLPEVPRSMENIPLKITYTSPIARAQEQVKANGLMRALGIMEPLLKYNPETVDIFDTDAMGRGVFDMFSISQKYLKDEKVVTKMRNDRQEAEQKKQDAENLRASGQGTDSLMRAGATAQEAGIPMEGFGVLQ